MTRVLVTGGSGYVGTHLIAALLLSGQEVRTTVRSLARADEVRAAVRRGGADDDGLEICAANLTEDHGWNAALSGCEEVHHVASPIPAVQPADPDALVGPARDGALRVLRAARSAGARRVVLTSSFVAVGNTPKPGFDYTEADWTDPDTPGLAPYARSKVLAERAAWEFMSHEGSGTELSVVNPTFIFGPTLITSHSASTRLVKAMLDGTVEVAPRTRFGIVDVRDLADLHLRVMAEPSAAGRRYVASADGPALSHLDVARVLRENLGAAGVRTPTQEAPGDELPKPIIHNDRARTDLGWRPRAVTTSILDTAESVRNLDLLERDSA